MQDEKEEKQEEIRMKEVEETLGRIENGKAAEEDRIENDMRE